MTKTADELFDEAMALDERHACRWLAFCWGLFKDRAMSQDLEQLQQALDMEKKSQQRAEDKKKGLLLF